MPFSSFKVDCCVLQRDLQAIIASIFTLYTFVFVFDNSMVWKIILIVIGWLLSTIFDFVKALKK